MASIFERKYKNGICHYYLNESFRENGKVKTIRTYLGTKPPIAKSRGWTNLSPEVIQWLKKRAEQKTKPVKTSPEQKGKYRTIVIDPPWPMARIDMKVNAEVQKFDYPTMTLTQIKHDRKLVPVRKLTAKDGCHIYIWTTQKFLAPAIDILNVWGFKLIFTMVWHKNGGMQAVGLPQFNCEFILFGKKGNIDFLTTKQFFTCFNATRLEHSRKPPEFYDIVRRVSPEPRIDIFSREKHEGFEQFGNETDKF